MKQLKIIEKEISDNLNKVSELNEQIEDLKLQKRKLTEIPKIEQYVGKYFKFLNDYGCHTEKGKEWYQYIKIINVKHYPNNSVFTANSFQDDMCDKIDFRYNEKYYSSYLCDKKLFKQISLEEYNDAFKKVIGKINEIIIEDEMLKSCDDCHETVC